MDEPSPSKAIWLLSLPLVPVLLGAALVGGVAAASLDVPAALGAATAYMVAAVPSIMILAAKWGWGRAFGIVATATVLGFGGLMILGAIVAFVIFGLIVAICGGGR